MTDEPDQRHLDKLDGTELLAIRTRWTARGAAAGRDPAELSHQLSDAQRDIGKLLRHLDAFSGPPTMGS